MATSKIKSARKAAGLSQEQLAEAVGLSISQISRFESGDREPRVAELKLIAERLRLPLESLIEAQPIPVMGRVGAGAEIEPEFEQVPPEGLFEVEVAVPLPPGMIGFEVVGDSMWPRYDDGDVIVCASEGVPQAIKAGEEAAVRTSDGRRFLKRVMREGNGFRLESHNAPPIINVQLEWASPVELLVKRSRWRKLESAVARTGAKLVRKNRKGESAG